MCKELFSKYSTEDIVESYIEFKSLIDKATSECADKNIDLNKLTDDERNNFINNYLDEFNSKLDSIDFCIFTLIVSTFPLFGTTLTKENLTIVIDGIKDIYNKLESKQ